MAPTTSPAPRHSAPDAASGVPRYVPRFDIVESETEWILEGDVPGVEQEQLDIRYEDGQLVVVGKVVDRHNGLRFRRREYGVGDYRRIFAIGETVDTDAISAELKNGVLTVHLPKVKAALPKRIEVRAK